MVLVSGFEIKKKEDGTSFLLLELSGSLELVQSAASGKFYATVRKCKIPSTFDSEMAKLMVGKQLEGDIVRVQSEPYNYTNKQTGEVMLLTHSYAYRPKGAVELIGNTQVENIGMTA